MTDYKLIAFDLDGTLLRKDKTISARTLRALRSAREAGALLVPATGRIYKALPQELRDLALVQYTINVNGAYVYDAVHDRALARTELSNERALELLEYMDKLDSLYDCYKDNWGYSPARMFPVAAEYISDPGILDLFPRTRTAVEDLIAFVRADGGSVQKTQMHLRDPEERLRQLELLPKLFPDVDVTSSIPTNIELTAKAATKGNALRQLCEALDIPLEATLAFGDGSNDLSLLHAAGHGVAMANAYGSVKAVADEVTDDNEHDGVAKVIERMLDHR